MTSSHRSSIFCRHHSNSAMARGIHKKPHWSLRIRPDRDIKAYLDKKKYSKHSRGSNPKNIVAFRPLSAFLKSFVRNYDSCGLPANINSMRHFQKRSSVAAYASSGDLELGERAWLQLVNYAGGRGICGDARSVELPAGRLTCWPRRAQVGNYADVFVVRDAAFCNGLVRCWIKRNRISAEYVCGTNWIVCVWEVNGRIARKA